MDNLKHSSLNLLKTAYLLLSLCLIPNTAASSDEGVNTDPYFDDDPNIFVIVEKPFRYLFNKKIFNDEIQRIEKAILLDGGKTKLMEFTIKANQDIFVSRYFKKMMYDAFMKDNKVYIYTKRPLPN
jgi:hypothetical protein